MEYRFVNNFINNPETKFDTIMQRFMFIVREDLKKIGQLTDDERLSNVPPPFEWIRSLAESSNYITGEPLAIKGLCIKRGRAFRWSLH
jgi:hypothetical protein